MDLIILIGQVKLVTHLAPAVAMPQLGVNSMSKKDDLDNHSNQLNPNHEEFWHSREYDERPEDWESQAELI